MDDTSDPTKLSKALKKAYENATIRVPREFATIGWNEEIAQQHRLTKVLRSVTGGSTTFLKEHAKLTEMINKCRENDFNRWIADIDVRNPFKALQYVYKPRARALPQGSQEANSAAAELLSEFFPQPGTPTDDQRRGLSLPNAHAYKIMRPIHKDCSIWCPIDFN